MSIFVINRFFRKYNKQTILFTSNGSFYVPTYHPITITAIGGGGGGTVHTGSYSYGAGGGGGSLRWTDDILLPIGTKLDIVVGRGGHGWNTLISKKLDGTNLDDQNYNGAMPGGYSSVTNSNTGTTYLLAAGGHGWSQWYANTTTTYNSITQTTSIAYNGYFQTRSSANGTSSNYGVRTVDDISYTIAGGNGGLGGNGYSASDLTISSGGASGGGGAGGFTGNGGNGGNANNNQATSGQTGSGGGGGGGGSKQEANSWGQQGGGTVIYRTSTNSGAGAVGYLAGGDGSGNDASTINFRRGYWDYYRKIYYSIESHDKHAFGWGGSGASYFFHNTIDGGPGAVYITFDT